MTSYLSALVPSSPLSSSVLDPSEFFNGSSSISSSSEALGQYGTVSSPQIMGLEVTNPNPMRQARVQPSIITIADLDNVTNNLVVGGQAKARERPQKLKGTNGDDTFTATGNTIYKGRGGDDQIFVRKSGNTLVGGGGSDVIDASKGKGDNILKGGGGDDTLIGRGRDDLLVGGGGSDLLVIADGKLNKGMSLIKGFQKSDTIGIFDVGKADSFEDLTFKKQKKDTLIRVGNRDIALVEKTKPSDLKARADDFLFATIPSLAISDRPNLPEGNSDATIEDFLVTLSQPSRETVTVNYALTPGNATPGVDYTGSDGTLTFSPGTTSATISVDILGDTLDESNESLTITLSNPVNAEIVDGLGNGVIVDDDEPIITRITSTYDGSSQNQEDLEVQFEIHTLDREGQAILDQASTNTKLGTFLGTIENYRTVDGKLEVVRDNGVELDNDDVVTENGFAVLSDDVPLVITDTLFELGNLEAKLVYNAPLFGNRTVIEYTLYTGTGSDRVDIKTSVLDIDQIGDSNNPADPFNDFPTRPLPDNFDRDLAINSIDYIVENHLLGLTVPLLDPDEDGVFEAGAVDIILQETFEQDLINFR